MSILDKAPLGQEIQKYETTYNPSLLYPISRRFSRSQLSLQNPLPFFGTDIWNAYELSWLNLNGKPQIAYGIFAVPSSSPNLLESKSLKLYLTSFNQTKFESVQQVKEVITKDLSKTSGQDVYVELITPPFPPLSSKRQWEQAQCLDELEATISTYKPNPKLLKNEDQSSIIEEKLYTNLFKSNCLKTGQPDWASVYIHYCGTKINHTSLLEYLISYRDHQGFHEQCVEQIFSDIFRYCYTQKLTVYARFTRRGGLDINPFRSNFQTPSENQRLFRQ
jgi:7-cyano-7-deazaguanine reductase